MKKLALIALLLGGCFFYRNDVNQRPSLEIMNPNSDTIGRGQLDVVLFAISNDPDADFVELSWRMNVCVDAADFTTCDQEPVAESSSSTFVFDAPVRLVAGGPAESLRVVLDGVDEFGAVAKPSQQLNIPLGNGKPTTVVTDQSDYDETKGTPIDVFAVYGDPDDGAEAVSVTWELLGPATVPLVPICTPIETCLGPPADGSKRQQGMTFTPTVEGEYTVRVTASDPLGLEGQTITDHVIFVNPDKHPCLGLVSPIAPVAPLQVPISDPTLFQVHQVVDALDPFPFNLADPLLGQAQFRWSIDREPQDNSTGNSLAFDPAVYVPGQIVEVRVEIADRINAFPSATTCDDDAQTCEHVTQCLQRQSWHVEVR